MRADVLFVTLGSTAGLRAAEEELAASLRRAGATVAIATPTAPRELRTFMLTDLAWATAARTAARRALAAGPAPGAILYSTTTAALRWPAPGAIRFDAPAAANRPGRHGLWQRPVERRRLEQATLLVPQDAGALTEAGAPATPSLIVPIPVEPSGPPAATRDLAAVTYATNPQKKGLDRVLAAWSVVRAPGEELVVAGVSEAAGRPFAGGGALDGVRFEPSLSPEAFRVLLRRARVYVTAPRREDYGLTQLEALADGCRVVTTAAPGPYAALPLLRGLEPGLVCEPAGLGTALRAALDAPQDDFAARALVALAPFRRIAVDKLVSGSLLPRLVPG